MQINNGVKLGKRSKTSPWTKDQCGLNPSPSFQKVKDVSLCLEQYKITIMVDFFVQIKGLVLNTNKSF